MRACYEIWSTWIFFYKFLFLHHIHVGIRNVAVATRGFCTDVCRQCSWQKKKDLRIVVCVRDFAKSWLRPKVSKQNLPHIKNTYPFIKVCSVLPECALCAQMDPHVHAVCAMHCSKDNRMYNKTNFWGRGHGYSIRRKCVLWSYEVLAFCVITPPRSDEMDTRSGSRDTGDTGDGSSDLVSIHAVLVLLSLILNPSYDAFLMVSQWHLLFSALIHRYQNSPMTHQWVSSRQQLSHF